MITSPPPKFSDKTKQKKEAENLNWKADKCAHIVLYDRSGNVTQS